MYIEPNSKINILKNVPLDNTYEHTIYFADIGSQHSYFSGKAKYTLTNQQYQRVQRGYIKVALLADDIYDCNYIMFQNSAYGTKWFYAFIKGIEYVSNACSQIEYEIDVLQTWFFDYILKQCMVDREHSATDKEFENLVAENFDLGSEYICNLTSGFDLNEVAISLLVSQDTDGTPAGCSYVGRTFSGLHKYDYSMKEEPETAFEGIAGLIESYISNGRENAIVSIYQYPEWIIDTGGQYREETQQVPILRTLDGYTPRNKKLYNYPFNYLLISNNNGQVAVIKYEYAQLDTNMRLTLKICGSARGTPAVMCYPVGYRGMSEDYDSGLSLTNFPICAWSGDTFKAWWAQNKATVATSGLTTALSAAVAVGGVVAAPATGGTSLLATGAALLPGVNSVLNMFGKVQDIKTVPPQVHGQVQTETLNQSIGRVQFNFYSMSISKEFAQIIDDFFDRYGYATHRNKIPNRNVRPHWTYCKTLNCTIVGSVPSDDMNKICQIYNNGITWWKSGDEVGNYSLNNTV